MAGGREREDDATAPRRRPRAEAAILDATAEILAESGVRGLTIEGVAERTGVAKTTIYRHWASKEDLALSLLIANARRMMPVADLGDTRAELVAVVRNTARTLDGTVMGRVMQGLVGALAESPELAEAFRRHVVATRHAALGEVIDRGIARGDLQPSVHHELASELLVGPVYYRLLLSHAALGGDFPDRVVAAAWPAMAGSARGPASRHD